MEDASTPVRAHRLYVAAATALDRSLACGRHDGARAFRSWFLIFFFLFGRVATRPHIFGCTDMKAPGLQPSSRILAVGAEALSMTPSGDALFAS